MNISFAYAAHLGNNKNDTHIAATKIQSHIRGHKIRNMIQKNHASIKIQRHIRGHNIRNMIQRNHAAIKIQSHIRGHKIRNKIKKNHASIKIQTLYRQYNSKKSIELKKRECSITKIQALFRGKSGRKLHYKIKEENKTLKLSSCAVKIQRNVRTKLAKAKLESLKASKINLMIYQQAENSEFQKWLLLECFKSDLPSRQKKYLKELYQSKIPLHVPICLHQVRNYIVQAFSKDNPLPNFNTQSINHLEYSQIWEKFIFICRNAPPLFLDKFSQPNGDNFSIFSKLSPSFCLTSSKGYNSTSHKLLKSYMDPMKSEKKNIEEVITSIEQMIRKYKHPSLLRWTNRLKNILSYHEKMINSYKRFANKKNISLENVKKVTQRGFYDRSIDAFRLLNSILNPDIRTTIIDKLTEEEITKSCNAESDGLLFTTLSLITDEILEKNPKSEGEVQRIIETLIDEWKSLLTKEGIVRTSFQKKLILAVKNKPSISESVILNLCSLSSEEISQRSHTSLGNIHKDKNRTREFEGEKDDLLTTYRARHHRLGLSKTQLVFEAIQPVFNILKTNQEVLMSNEQPNKIKMSLLPKLRTYALQKGLRSIPFIENKKFTAEQLIYSQIFNQIRNEYNKIASIVTKSTQRINLIRYSAIIFKSIQEDLVELKL